MLCSKNECVEINFGAKPFKFDLEVRALQAGLRGQQLHGQAGTHSGVSGIPSESDSLVARCCRA